MNALVHENDSPSARTASDLAAKFRCATNTMAMYLHRRKSSRDSGIYQATGFKFKTMLQ